MKATTRAFVLGVVVGMAAHYAYANSTMAKGN